MATEPSRTLYTHLRDTDPRFHNYWTHHIRNTKNYPALDELIDNFRRHLREDTDTRSSSHGAFPATYQDESLNVTTESTKERTQVTKANADKKKPTNCLCGEDHQFKDCPYIVESVRPLGWVPNPDTTQQVEKKIKNNPRLKGIINGIRNGANKTAKESETEKDLSKEPAGFTTICSTAMYSASSRETYPLRDSFILDSGATVHVCKLEIEFLIYFYLENNETMLDINYYRKRHTRAIIYPY